MVESFCSLLRSGVLGATVAPACWSRQQQQQQPDPGATSARGLDHHTNSHAPATDGNPGARGFEGSCSPALYIFRHPRHTDTPLTLTPPQPADVSPAAAPSTSNTPSHALWNPLEPPDWQPATYTTRSALTNSPLLTHLLHGPATNSPCTVLTGSTAATVAAAAAAAQAAAPGPSTSTSAPLALRLGVTRSALARLAVGDPEDTQQRAWQGALLDVLSWLLPHNHTPLASPSQPPAAEGFGVPAAAAGGAAAAAVGGPRPSGSAVSEPRSPGGGAQYGREPAGVAPLSSPGGLGSPAAAAAAASGAAAPLSPGATGSANGTGEESGQFDAGWLFRAIRPSGSEEQWGGDPPELRPRLRPYQRRAVAWMLRREQQQQHRQQEGQRQQGQNGYQQGQGTQAQAQHDQKRKGQQGRRGAKGGGNGSAGDSEEERGVDMEDDEEVDEDGQEGGQGGRKQQQVDGKDGEEVIRGSLHPLWRRLHVLPLPAQPGDEGKDGDGDGGAHGSDAAPEPVPRALYINPYSGAVAERAFPAPPPVLGGILAGGRVGGRVAAALIGLQLHYTGALCSIGSSTSKELCYHTALTTKALKNGHSSAVGSCYRDPLHSRGKE